MSDPDQNRLRDMPQTFNAQTPWPVAPSRGASRDGAAPKPLRAKIFKSGNSLALRLPAALELEAGMEMLVTPDGSGGYHLRAAPVAGRKFNIDAIWGIGRDLGLQPLAPEDRVFAPSKRPWDEPDWPGWGNEEA